MRSAWALAVAASSLWGVDRVASADDYQMDPRHTSILFGVSHMGYSYTYGRFDKLTGGFSLGANPEENKFQLTIDAGSVNTNDAQRDMHLKNADFFNVQQFPLITFVSKRVVPEQTKDGLILHVLGSFTMHGVTKEIELDLQKLGEGPGPTQEDYRTGFLCQLKLLRSDFGINHMIPQIGDEIAITISFEGIHM